MVTLRPIGEVIDFITAFPESHQILDYKASPALQERIENLVYKKKTSELSSEEVLELERYLLLQHIMITAKKEQKNNRVYESLYC
jgi:hypothetical protein